MAMTSSRGKAQLQQLSRKMHGVKRAFTRVGVTPAPYVPTRFTTAAKQVESRRLR
jgi:hypothetical protein